MANWKLIIGAAAVGTLAYLLLKNKKSEKKSEFLGSPIGKTVQFTLTNNTSTEQETTLFNSFTNSSNPNVGVQAPNSSLPEFNRSLLSEPIRINSIEVRANGTNASVQSQKPITKVCKDASGNSDTEFFYPMVSANQVQGGITTVQPSNLILDGTCFLKYPVAPNSVVTLVFNYDVVTKQSPVAIIRNKKRRNRKSTFRF